MPSTPENDRLVVEKLSCALTCPLNCEELKLGVPCSMLVYELWFALLHTYLPEPWYASVLQGVGPWAYAQRTPDEGAVLELGRSDEELLQAAVYVARSRKGMRNMPGFDEPDASIKNSHLGMDYVPQLRSPCGIWLDEAFLELTQWLVNFAAVPRAVRTKHWPDTPAGSPKAAFLAESARKGDEGLLLPNISADDLRAATLDGFAWLVNDQIHLVNDSHFQEDRTEDLLQAWRDLSQGPAYRFAVRYEAPVGAYRGRDANYMVFDFDPKASQVHGYPADVDPTGSVAYLIEDEGIGELDVRAGEYLGLR